LTRSLGGYQCSRGIPCQSFVLKRTCVHVQSRIQINWSRDKYTT
jgi:hypothetical protein